MTDYEWIQKYAKEEVAEAHRRLEALITRGADLTFDQVNDAAEFLNVAASRLRG